MSELIENTEPRKKDTGIVMGLLRKERLDGTSDPAIMTAIVKGDPENGSAVNGPTTNLHNNEQPVSKRQKMDGMIDYHESDGPEEVREGQPIITSDDDQDDVDDDKLRDADDEDESNDVNTSRFSSNNSSSTSNNNNNNSPGGSSKSSLVSVCIDETDKGLLTAATYHNSHKREFLRTSPPPSGSGASHHKESKLVAPSSSTSYSSASPYPDLLHRQSMSSEENLLDAEMLQFQSSLVKQCLCGVSERILRRPFESHYIVQLQRSSREDISVRHPRRVAALNEWPQRKLVQFLSNLQLLFDVYLKQNAKGSICARIMDVCEALKRDEQNLIDSIIDLCDYDNKFVQFLSGRVLSSFMIIVKDDDTSVNQTGWLNRLIDNLFPVERMDSDTIRRMNFSLKIIKRIVEWKDVEVHPLEDDDDDDDEGDDEDRVAGATASRQVGGGHHIDEEGGALSMPSSLSNYRLPLPSLENNYFAAHYNPEMVSSNSDSSHHQHHHHHQQHQHQQVVAGSRPDSDCDLIQLTDSESFDTSNLKCLTIQSLVDRCVWPALVNNMSALIMSGAHNQQQQQMHQRQDGTNYGESCVLTFLQLWESIISVHTNLAFDQTLPFYAKLDCFELILLNCRSQPTIYKQMLVLFNEVLCYGSTLALQDMPPEETCNLANQVVRQVKDGHLLDTLPRIQPENVVNMIGNRGATVVYGSHTLEVRSMGGPTSTGVDMMMVGDEEVLDMDKTLLQKMVLLVLKSVAVTVKEIRSDSSDSSIDSTDYEAFQDMVVIERSIRDVMKKLENFMKNTLEFHPESHFSKILIHLFGDQDDYLIEAMVCILDVTVGISFRNNAFPELVAILNPVLTFLEYLKMISNSEDLLLDLLISNETCFLLYLLRFLKYIRLNWPMFVASCNLADSDSGTNCLESAMGVLTRLRQLITRLVSMSLYPYDISPVLRLLESCEDMYAGNEFR